MASHLRTKLVLDALNMAVQRRRSDGVLHRPDQGRQYSSVAFGHRCEDAGIRPSMGSVGGACDNALCERFFGSIECELIEGVSLQSFTRARREVFEYVEGWYNPHRRHSVSGYESLIKNKQNRQLAA